MRILGIDPGSRCTGFGIIDDAGEFSGFDIDYCRVVAALWSRSL